VALLTSIVVAWQQETLRRADPARPPHLCLGSPQAGTADATTPADATAPAGD